MGAFELSIDRWCTCAPAALMRALECVLDCFRDAEVVQTFGPGPFLDASDETL